MNVCEAHPCCCFLTSVGEIESYWRGVLPLQWKLGKRERVLEDDVFIENTCLGIGSKTQDEIYADVVLRRSHGSPGQWFPETEYVCVRHLCRGNKWHTAQIKL